MGLDAQRDAVAAHVRGVSGAIVGEFQEIESGANKSRPKLADAITLARSKKATLVIAKLDRLARNVHFISQLMESGVEFVAADLPHANKLTIHIIAAVAEYEREMIANRTRSALKHAKERGVVLGNPRAALQSRLASQKASSNADAFAQVLYPQIKSLRDQSVTSYRGIAAALNFRGVRTQRGYDWTAAGVRNVESRARRLGI